MNRGCGLGPGVLLGLLSLLVIVLRCISRLLTRRALSILRTIAQFPLDLLVGKPDFLHRGELRVVFLRSHLLLASPLGRGRGRSRPHLLLRTNIPSLVQVLFFHD
jgi:hypothetical protein